MAGNDQYIDLNEKLHQSLIAIKKLKAQLDEEKKLKNEPIAVVGMECRFPGGNNTKEFWNLLYNNKSAVTEVPESRWKIEDYYDPNVNAKGKIYTKHGAFIDGVEYFDAGFFGITPREALYMDPQQRLLLEVCWHALENANIAPSSLYKSLTGIYIGLTNFDYASVIKNTGKDINRYVVTGNVLCMAAGRISNALGLMGPSMVIDTSCSSSLVALHTACLHLRNKECDAALVGGANLIFSPEVNINLCDAKMLSADGLCHTFDASANGYVRGEGCGVVVLKRLSDAIANNDKILACIKGSAINHDGPSGGLTVPNGSSQQYVIEKAMKSAAIPPHDIDYIETHGTGTPLGDPIELDTLAKIFKNNSQQQQRLKIGSVKTNIGHLEPAAGIAGLIKLILSLQNEIIPAHLNFVNPNPYFSWNEEQIEVVTKNTPWKKGNKKRIGALSSFGFSGTNSHLIVEEGIERKVESHTNENAPSLLALSAHSEEALQKLMEMYLNYLNTNSDLNFSDICYTANTCRTHFKYRKTIIANSSTEAVKILSNILNGNSEIPLKNINNSPIENSAEKYLNGKEIDWAKFYHGAKLNKVTIPNYPFQRQKYWIADTGLTSSKILNKNEYAKNNSEENSSVTILINKLKSAPNKKRYQLLLKEISIEVAKVMELPAPQLPDADTGFIELGIDSIMGLELKNKLEQGLGYTISATTLFNYPTISSLTRFLLGEIFLPEELQDIPLSENKKLESAKHGLPLSREEEDQLLLEMLENLKIN